MSNVLKKNFLMIKYIYKYCPSYIAISIVQSVFVNVLSVVGLLYTKYVVDSLTENRSYVSIFFIALGIFLFQTLLTSISAYLTQYITPKNVELLSQGMLNEIFEQAIKIDYECYENTKFFSDFTMAINQSNQRALEVLQTFTTFIGSLLGITSFSALISTLDPFLFVAVAMNVSINMYFSIVNSKKQHQYYEERLKPSREQGYAQRVFYLNIYAKELRLFNKLPQIIRKVYNDAVCKLLNITYKFAKTFSILLILQNYVSNLSTFLTTLYIVYRVLNGYLRISDYFVLTSSISQLTMQITNLFQVIPQLYTHSLYIENFLDFMNYEPNVKNIENAILVSDEKCIKFKNVFFSYPNTKKSVLNNINFEIKKNEKVAFVGENGSGKSTLIKIITRLYDIDDGCVLLENRNIGEYDLESLRDHIGIVFQDYQLLSISILENILMRPIVDKEKDENIAWEALKKVGLYEKVKALPEGIYTKYSNEFDENGIFFSGGEMQAIAIARLYVKRCNIVILDEPSSALDPIAERKIFDMTLKFCQDKTIILISHRLTNVVHVDRIFYIEDGKIVESGSHRQLMKLRGKYCKMYNIQAGNCEGI